MEKFYYITQEDSGRSEDIRDRAKALEMGMTCGGQVIEVTETIIGDYTRIHVNLELSSADIAMLIGQLTHMTFDATPAQERTFKRVILQLQNQRC